MTQDDIINVLHFIRPGAQWVLRGTDFENMEWLDKTQTKPTGDELAAGFKLLVADQETERLRPSIHDQLSAIWEGGNAMESMRQTILASKKKTRGT